MVLEAPTVALDPAALSQSAALDSEVDSAVPSLALAVAWVTDTALAPAPSQGPKLWSSPLPL